MVRHRRPTRSVLSHSTPFRRNKYNAQKCGYQGQIFDSKGERACYLYLLALEQSGAIQILSRQDTIYLTKARIAYRCDFKVYDTKLHKEIWIEFKGCETAVWKIKKRLWKHYGPGILRIYKGNEKSITLVEQISPKPE
jgi:hypothetical protein